MSSKVITHCFQIEDTQLQNLVCFKAHSF